MLICTMATYNTIPRTVFLEPLGRDPRSVPAKTPQNIVVKRRVKYLTH